MTSNRDFGWKEIFIEFLVSPLESFCYLCIICTNALCRGFQALGTMTTVKKSFSTLWQSTHIQTCKTKNSVRKIFSLAMCASQMVLVVKNLPARAGDIKDVGSIPGLGRSPGGRHGSHSSILAWRIPWTKEPGRLRPIGSRESQTPLKQRTGSLSMHVLCVIHFNIFILFHFILN